jgi:HlyD family secretion protein
MISTFRRFGSIVALLVIVTACGSDRNNGRVHASGHIEATEVRLASKVGGQLIEAPFEEGDHVSQGDVVARLETIDAELRLARARAVAGSADAQLRLLLAGSRAEDLRRAEDQLGQARAELEAAARDFDRLDGLAERGSTTVKARDDAATRREIAQRAVAAARAQLDKLVSGPRSQEIEAARAQRAAAEAEVDAIRQQIADATVLAPRAGVLVERVAEPGEILPPGAVIAVLVDLARPWLDVWVGEPSLARIRFGDPVEVRVDGHEQSLEGTVAYISDVAEFTPKNVQTPEERAKLVFRVKIALDNREGLFKPGMPADAWFGGDRVEQAE